MTLGQKKDKSVDPDKQKIVEGIDPIGSFQRARLQTAQETVEYLDEEALREEAMQE